MRTLVTYAVTNLATKLVVAKNKVHELRQLAKIIGQASLELIVVPFDGAKCGTA
jgi:hypothetical protein